MNKVLNDQASMFDLDAPPIVKTWKPAPLSHEQWPPDYTGVYAWRVETLGQLRRSSAHMVSARAYYSTRPAEFIMHWMDTYNPRKTTLKWMPFVFFDRQQQFIDFLHELRADQESGLCEKCRDAGATWLACAYSVWSWLFIDNDAIGWGSRKADLVDKIGDADSIFEKMRLIINRLPNEWLPDGFTPKKHATYMKITNPVNGSSITGESGDNIGRGGRKSMYFKDEAAHYERPEKIEAALGDNTNVQVDISSVNGLGNVFHRRREAGFEWHPGHEIATGQTRVFVIDWTDHPEKDQAWYDRRKAKHEREGMMHIFAQEVERNYSAAVTNTIIEYEWIKSSVDAHLTVPYLADMEPPDVWGAGLDVADEGVDRNALAQRQWIIWRDVQEWGERDTGATARRAINEVRGHKGIHVQYDSIGLGASVKAEFNRMVEDPDIDLSPYDVLMIPWNAGGKVVRKFARVIESDEQSVTNGQMFYNMKAQAWWSLRTRFYKTHLAVTTGAVYRDDELISLDSRMPLLHQLMKELAQAVKTSNGSLQMIVDKQPDGTKSPNLADAGVMMYFPIDPNHGAATSEQR